MSDIAIFPNILPTLPALMYVSDHQQIVAEKDAELARLHIIVGNQAGTITFLDRKATQNREQRDAVVEALRKAKYEHEAALKDIAAVLNEREEQIATLTDQLVAAIQLHAEVRHALEAIAHQMGRS